ncbi:polyphosphate polymerase domain-containing protein [Flavobacteriaceae bacterium]|nr:polyphosphate polymerase domain-containing protein [Flavobacteriaceae bacterium]MDB9712754.1 polyphosphate polymerase domain-containing protein [Flavobacteriaceae bacterium]MDC1493049.1 polyphosphate polymerase domain-containing protein [Flavobacteriaceae bacterium]
MNKFNLLSFDKTTLDEMNGVSLMKRVDTKFILTESQLFDVLPKLYRDYKILEIEQERLMKYSTLYFDTQNKKCFNEHHNGKLNRYKIRMRKYLVSDICFLEIKKKNNLGITNKIRKKIKDFETDLSVESKEFISDSYIDNLLLEPSLYNNFSRMTFVNRNESERITIDMDLSFSFGDKEKKFDKLVVIEIKQEGKRLNTTINRALKSMSILPTNFSKYCIGITNTLDNIKSNAFKEINLKINKLNN